MFIQYIYQQNFILTQTYLLDMRQYYKLDTINLRFNLKIEKLD